MKHISAIAVLLALRLICTGQSAGNILYYETGAPLNYAGSAQPFVQPRAYFNSPNEILLEVNAMYNATASSYLAIFHLAQVGSTAREADSLINHRISAFQKTLKPLQLSDTSFVIDMLTMLPVYEVEVTRKMFSKTYTEIPAGFEIQKNIHIHFTRPEQLDKIMTAAAMQEIYDLIKVDYYVKDQAAIYDKLRKEASELIKKRIAQYTDLGVAMEGQWRLAADQTGVFFPLDRYTTYTSRSGFSLEAAKKKTVTEVKKPTSAFYNKIPYTGYDIVINPEIVEPAVQFTYNLQVRFTMEKKQEKKEEAPKQPSTEIRYILVTPEGNTKELPTK